MMRARPSRRSLLRTLLLTVAGAATAGCADLARARHELADAVVAKTHPPGVIVENASLRGMRVRFWVGRIDVARTPGGVDVESPGSFFVGPHDSLLTGVGRAGWAVPQRDTITRVRVEPRFASDAPMADAEPRWYEFVTPPPHRIRMINDTSQPQGLGIETFGGARVVPVPREQWIESAVGRYPAE